MAAVNFPNSPSVNDTHTSSGSTWKWDGGVWQRLGTAGPQGAQGVQGAQGAQGHQGVQGAQGHQGRQGSVGIASLTIATSPPGSPDAGDMWWDSDDGDLHLYYNDGNSSQWANINNGPAGAQGAVGAQGAQGHQGVQGAQGHQGVQGAQGHQGHQGVQGAANATTINNNANNRIITGSGTANTLEGESNFTYDGNEVAIYAQTDDTDAILHLVGKTASGGVGQAGRTAIIAESTNNSNGQSSMHFRTRNTSNAQLIGMTIDGNQNVGINEATPDFSGFGSNGGGIELDDVNSGFTAVKVSHGAADMYLASAGSAAFISTRTNHDIIVEKNSAEVARFTDNGLKFPNGKGLDFASNTAGGGTSTGTVLEDYEEGTWTPVLSFANYSVGTQSNSGSYVKIGNMCHCEFTLHVNSSQITGSPSSGGWVRITGIPYNSSNSVGYQYLGNPAACGKLKQYVGQNGSNDFNKIFFYMPGNSSYMALGANKDPQTSIGTDYLYGLSEETWAGAVNDSSNHNTEMRASFSYRTI